MKNSLVATAPYNFVPLPKEVLSAPLDEPKNLSGEIHLEITTLTPLFIGNDLQSFKPVDKPIIPGSSLRGMFKNLFKIVTCGAFRGTTDSQKKGEDFNDEHIYFRCMMAPKGSPAWMKDLNYHYTKDLMTDRKTGKKKARPGFLIYKDDKFFIVPSSRADNKTDREPIYKYLQKYRSEKSCITWEGHRAYIFTGKGVKKKYVRFTSLDYVKWDGEWLELTDEVLNSYRHDRNRGGVDLLDKDNPGWLGSKDLPEGVEGLIPCHYITDGKHVKSFGHGQCFRVAYEKSIGNAVRISGNEQVDFADEVFGRENLASRVYFEDATSSEKIQTLPPNEAHPLMQPNPTSYQLYLTQNDKRGKLKHWDTSGVEIRGYKLYWNKKNPQWQANDFERRENKRRLDNGKEPLIKKITPLKEGSKFTSKIRFKNLRAIELGALMMLFDLDGLRDKAAYKIGKGKSFGLGSIKIKATLFIEDETAYTELFDADGWKSPCRAEKPDAYLKAFKDYAKKNASWDDVMENLREMSDWSHTHETGWDDKVKQMSGKVKKNLDGTETLELDDKFKQRMPLQTIFEVVGK